MLNAFLWEVRARPCVCACMCAEEESHIALCSGKDIFNWWEMLERAMTDRHFCSYTGKKNAFVHKTAVAGLNSYGRKHKRVPGAYAGHM